MESQVLLSCSQQPASGTYPEPDESSPHLPHSISLRSILMLFFHLRVGQTSVFQGLWLYYLIN
jgi:hypothetical protein